MGELEFLLLQNGDGSAGNSQQGDHNADHIAGLIGAGRSLGSSVVHAHPFRDRMVVADPAPVWGIEVYNGVNEPFRNHMAREFASHYGKMMTSGSDCHYPGACGRGGIITEQRITTPKELSAVLRSGAYTLIET